MTRIILTLVASLIFVMILTLASLTGLFALSGMLEQKIAVGEINRDIQFLTNTAIQTGQSNPICQKISLSIKELPQYALSKKSNENEILIARKKLTELGHQIAQCAQEETRLLLSKHDAMKTKTALFSFVKGLDIAGRQSNLVFSDEEKSYYKKIMYVYEKSIAKEKIEVMTINALPIYELTMQRLNKHVLLLSKE